MRKGSSLSSDDKIERITVEKDVLGVIEYPPYIVHTVSDEGSPGTGKCSKVPDSFYALLFGSVCHAVTAVPYSLGNGISVDDRKYRKYSEQQALLILFNEALHISLGNLHVGSDVSYKKRRPEIVKETVSPHFLLVEVGIAVETCIGAGVVGADVDRGEASAGWPLVSVLVNTESISADTFESVFVNAVGMLDTERIVVMKFRASIEDDSVSVRNLDHLREEESLLFENWSSEAQALRVAESLVIEVNEAHSTFLGIRRDTGAVLREFIKVVINSILAAEEYRVITPEYPLLSESLREGDECRDEFSLLRRNIRLCILVIPVDGVCEVIASLIYLELSQSLHHRDGILCPEYDAVNDIGAEIHPADGFRIHRIRNKDKALLHPVEEPWCKTRRNICTSADTQNHQSSSPPPSST